MRSRAHDLPRPTHTLARGLGWFSIGLGLAELLAPAQGRRFLGMEEHTGLIRAYGAREIATGIGILTQDADPLDLGARRRRRARSGHARDRPPG